MHPIKLQMSLRQWSMLLGLSVLWGGSFFFMGVAVKGLPPATIVLLRVALAFLTLLLLLLATGQRLPLNGRTIVIFIILGLLNNAIPFNLITWGVSHIPSSLGAILNASTPLWTLIVAHFLTHDEKMTRARVAGIVVGFSGIVVMVGIQALSHLGTAVFAQLAVLGGAISYAFAGTIGRRFQNIGMNGLQLATGQFCASTLMLLPLTLAVDRPWQLPMPGPAVWGAVACLAVVSTGLAYLIYFRLLKTAGAVNLTLVTLLVPVTAILLGSMFLDERLEPNHFTGMALIALGLACIDGRVFRLFARRNGEGPPTGVEGRRPRRP